MAMPNCNVAMDVMTLTSPMFAPTEMSNPPPSRGNIWAHATMARKAPWRLTFWRFANVANLG